ncbi:hypothetical protein [Candidatus Uabimicrobium sp. HlEnr_7]|uniref:hypothetical protein n=1 Tax=Candidatus Uabimicrobium helgolandensis TaxID=3095367 RepID=UPI0035563C20
MNCDTNKCKFIRSRATDIPILPNGETLEDDSCRSGVFWCTHTMTAVGPDDDFVAPEKCQSVRQCYKKID